MDIWNDLWILRAWSRRVITLNGASLLTTVDELISQLTGQWDGTLARDTYRAEDANHIMQIPLRDGVEDFIA